MRMLNVMNDKTKFMKTTPNITTTDQPVTKYVGYIRVSTKDRQDCGEEVQRQHLLKYDNVVHIFVDRISGKISNTKRAGLSAALAMCKENGYTLLFYTIARLSRNVADLFQIRDSGVELKCITVPELNTMSLGTFGLFAQIEREDISSRTKQALAVKKASGVKLGCPVAVHNLLMYAAPVMLYNRKLEAYNFHHKNAMFAKRMWTEEGKTLAQIADIFKELGIVNQDGKDYSLYQVGRIIKKFTGEPPVMPNTPQPLKLNTKTIRTREKIEEEKKYFIEKTGTYMFE